MWVLPDFFLSTNTYSFMYTKQVCCKNRNGIQVHTLNEQNRAHRFNERTMDFLVGDAPPSLSVKLPCILSYGGTVDLMTFLTLQQLSLHGDPHNIQKHFHGESPQWNCFLCFKRPSEAVPASRPTTCSTGGVGAGFCSKGPSPTHLQSLWLDYFSPSFLSLLYSLHTGPSSSANLLKVVS